MMSMFDNSVDELSYTMKAGDYKETDLVVARFEAREGLSQLFVWQIDVIVDAEAIPTLEGTQGLPGEFRILRHDKEVRVVRGVIARVTPQGSTSKGRQHQVTLTLLPKLAELDLMTNSRIFQNVNVQQIVMDLVKPFNIELVWRIERRPETRTYCVQKNETDFQFFARILAEDGIHFSFLHDKEKTAVVFVDAPRGYVAIDGDQDLPYSATGGAVTVDHVGAIERTQVVRPGSVTFRDYNFERPRTDLTARAEVKEPHNAGNRPARETYLYAGSYDKVDPDGNGIALRHLEQVRSDAIVFSGRSSCVRLQMGRTFKLVGHDDDLFNRALLVTDISIRGERSGIAETGGKGGPAFVLNFVAVPSDVRLRPQRKAKPPAPPESALVVGPEPGTPYLDDHGRVKVHFFWDRQSKQDANSSCWLRVMTPAAGGDRGIWFAPRVGDEVVVNFFNGDIDRPFVAGAMYNGEQGHTYLPAKTVTKSTIRTLTIPGGNGHNELTFEDSAGGEEIYLHAQRNHRETILANHSESIGANQSTSVGAMQSISVGAMRSKTVGGDEHTHIGLNRTEEVGQKESVTIGMGRDVTISAGHDDLTVMNGTRQVGIRNGHQITTVQYITRFVTKDMEIVCDEDYKLDAVRTIAVSENSGNSAFKMEAGAIGASGPSGISVQNQSQQINLKDKKISIFATDELVLQCGNASLSLKADGTVSINGTKAIGLSVQSSKVSLDSKSSKVEGSSATISATGVCTVSGAFVKIN